MAYVQWTIQLQQEILGSVVSHSLTFQNIIASDITGSEKHMHDPTYIHISLYLYPCVYVCAHASVYVCN